MVSDQINLQIQKFLSREALWYAWLLPRFFRLFSFFAIFLISPIWSNEINVSAQIDPYHNFENHPLQGTVSITHSAKESVDVNSFRLGGNPLQVDMVKNVSMPSGGLELSIYQFEIPGQSAGLYALPEISVKVGKEVYTTIPSTYEVFKASPAQAAAQSDVSKATLTLQTNVDAPPIVYPGMIIKFVYRYLYTGDIELTSESLPLLDAQGFTKIGEKEIKNYVQNDVNVQEVSQVVKATIAGTFTFQPSHIEGYAYAEKGPAKKRTYLQPKLHSETPEMIITVAAFPAKGKPSSFNGAVGEFTFETSLLSSPVVHVDEKMQLALDIAGVASLNDVPMPSLSGLKSLFRFSDLPPVGQINNSTERYVVDIYPLSKEIKEIPAIEFAYLEPISGTYVVLKSQPIKITVLEQSASIPEELEQLVPKVLPTPQPPQPAVQEKAPLIEDVKVPSTLPSLPAHQSQKGGLQVEQPAAVEISSIYELSKADLYNLPFGTWKAFWIVPIGGLLFGFQLWLKNFMKKISLVVRPKKAREFFQEAMQAPFDSPEFFSKLSKSFMLRLIERKEISSEMIPEKLPETGVSGEVRSFLTEIEEQRFTGKTVLQESEVKERARQIFHQLEE